MPRIIVSTEIEATPQHAWDLMCDAKLYSDWVVPTDAVLESPDGPIERGSVYREHGGIPPFKADSEWNVTEFEPTRRQVHVGDDGTMTMTLEILIEPAASGSALTLDIDFKPRWYLLLPVSLMWVLMMGKRGTEAMRQTAANFKKLAESQS